MADVHLDTIEQFDPNVPGLRHESPWFSWLGKSSRPYMSTCDFWTSSQHHCQVPQLGLHRPKPHLRIFSSLGHHVDEELEVLEKGALPHKVFPFSGPLKHLGANVSRLCQPFLDKCKVLFVDIDRTVHLGNTGGDDRHNMVPIPMVGERIPRSAWLWSDLLSDVDWGGPRPYGEHLIRKRVEQ